MLTGMGRQRYVRGGVAVNGHEVNEKNSETVLEAYENGDVFRPGFGVDENGDGHFGNGNGNGNGLRLVDRREENSEKGLTLA